MLCCGYPSVLVSTRADLVHRIRRCTMCQRRWRTVELKDDQGSLETYYKSLATKRRSGRALPARDILGVD